MILGGQFVDLLRDHASDFVVSVLAGLVFPFFVFLFKGRRFLNLLLVILLFNFLAAFAGHTLSSGMVSGVSLCFAGITLGIILLSRAVGLHDLKLKEVLELLGPIARLRKVLASEGKDRTQVLQDFTALLRNPHDWEGFGTDQDLERPPQSREAASMLLALNRRVCRLPESLQPLVAFIADESTALLLSQPGRLGEDISAQKYIKLLELGLKGKDICDVTFFQTVPPCRWGDPDAPETELAKSAWRYFDVQERLKKESDGRIKMRRVLLIEADDWKGNGKDKNDPEVAQALRFKEKHDKAGICLWLVAPSMLSQGMQSYVQDMAIFYTSDGDAWLIWSDVDEWKLEVSLFHAGLYYWPGNLPDAYRGFLGRIFEMTHSCEKNPNPLRLTDDRKSNNPSAELLKKVGIK